MKALASSAAFSSAFLCHYRERIDKSCCTPSSEPLISVTYPFESLLVVHLRWFILHLDRFFHLHMVLKWFILHLDRFFHLRSVFNWFILHLNQSVKQRRERSEAGVYLQKENRLVLCMRPFAICYSPCR